MLLAAESLFITHPKYAMAIVFVLLGVFLIVSVVWSDATGEMQQEQALGRSITVSREDDPKKFQTMLHSCVVGAIACFGCALASLLFL
ncbi:MAG: hypothetical protein JWM57_4231 [Phycisphaerales bacterium]|nr:hypothetical protein [Phycisphaerales bacterium]